jgi:glutathione-specific gamma-glutamylcyclotransferase
LSEETPKDEFTPVVPPGGLLKREHFNDARVRQYAQEIAKQGDFPFMSEEDRAASLKAFRETIEPGSDVWVFGYGSLMWNPAIHVVESHKAHLHGFHRAFCLTLSIGRGSAEHPGLMLALDAGGEATGVAHRIAADAVESELTILWFREMLSGAYIPRWVDLEIENVGPSRALAFVINHAHPRYINSLNEAQIAQRMAVAEGILGTNRDYLYRTARHLDELGVNDGLMQRLEKQVRELANEPLQGEVK